MEQTRYRVIFTDQDFVLDDENIFKSNGIYKGNNHWGKSNDEKPLVLIDSSLPNIEGLLEEVMEQILINHKDNIK